MSRTACGRGRAARKPPAVPEEAKITRTSPFGMREGYEKYSAETSAAIKSSCGAA